MKLILTLAKIIKLKNIFLLLFLLLLFTNFSYAQINKVHNNNVGIKKNGLERISMVFLNPSVGFYPTKAADINMFRALQYYVYGEQIDFEKIMFQFFHPKANFLILVSKNTIVKKYSWNKYELEGYVYYTSSIDEGSQKKFYLDYKESLKKEFRDKLVKLKKERGLVNNTLNDFARNSNMDFKTYTNMYNYMLNLKLKYSRTPLEEKQSK